MTAATPECLELVREGPLLRDVVYSVTSLLNLLEGEILVQDLLFQPSIVSKA